MRDRPAWAGELLDALQASGQAGLAAAQFVRERKIRIGARKQQTGARWTLGRGIDLQPRYAQELHPSPYALSLVVHEVHHIKQGAVVALSIYGELDAWQVQFRYLLEIIGDYSRIPGDAGAISDILALPLGWDRSVLRAARGLMRRYAGNQYRIGLLPLYPLHHELLYGLARRRPG